MRKLIAVSEQERAELLAWADESPPLLASKILAVVVYREEVLSAFDALVESFWLTAMRNRPANGTKNPWPGRFN